MGKAKFTWVAYAKLWSNQLQPKPFALLKDCWQLFYDATA
jgi:hypothetical protein